MSSFELAEKFSCRPYFPFFRILETLTDTFIYVGASGNVEQALNVLRGQTRNSSNECSSHQ
jgi:hypothetical protein